MSTSRRRRLSPDDREAQIIAGAIRFFAEVGLNGQTRALAEQLGITQPLLYQYFPSKQHLLDRIYHELFEKPWKKEWQEQLQDRSRPLRQRLIEFYTDYTATIFTYEWMRIYMFSGLAGAVPNQKYIKRVENQLLKTIYRETRAAYGVDDPDRTSISQRELELVWNLHGGIIYYGIRKYIYQLKVPSRLDLVIEEFVDTMLDGLPQTVQTFGNSSK